MKKFLLIFWISALLSGCGMEKQTNSEHNQGNGDESKMVVPELDKKGPLIYQYKIKNQTGNEVKLEFSSSQRYDFSLYNEDGKRVYLYSSTAVFLQVLGEENLSNGDQLEYKIDLTKQELEEGTYTLTVWMACREGKKYKTSREITI